MCALCVIIINGQSYNLGKISITIGRGHIVFGAISISTIASRRWLRRTWMVRKYIFHVNSGRSQSNYSLSVAWNPQVSYIYFGSWPDRWWRWGWRWRWETFKQTKMETNRDDNAQHKAWRSAGSNYRKQQWASKWYPFLFASFDGPQLGAHVGSIEDLKKSINLFYEN